MINDLSDVTIVTTSCLNSIGIEKAKDEACKMLLRQRVEYRLTTNRVEPIENRLNVTNIEIPNDRPPSIPDSVLKQRATNEKVHKQRLLRELEEENGGPGVYSIDLNKEWNLSNESWRYDKMPEFFAGKNILDFVDPEIEKLLTELEKEEDILLQKQGVDINDIEEWKETSQALKNLHSKIQLKRIEKRLKTNNAHKLIPRPLRPLTTSTNVTSTLKKIGYHVDDSGIKNAPRRNLRSILARTSSQADDNDYLTEDEDMSKSNDKPVKLIHKKLNMLNLTRTKGIGSNAVRLQAIQKAKAQQINKITKSLHNPKLVNEAQKIKRKKDKRIAVMGRVGEADRFIGTKMPKHLFSGKMSNGKKDYR